MTTGKTIGLTRRTFAIIIFNGGDHKSHNVALDALMMLWTFSQESHLLSMSDQVVFVYANFTVFLRCTKKGGSLWWSETYPLHGPFCFYSWLHEKV